MEIVGFFLEFERNSVGVLSLEVVIFERKGIFEFQELHILLVGNVSDDS